MRKCHCCSVAGNALGKCQFVVDNSKHDFDTPTVLLGLLLYPWMCVSFFFFFFVGSNSVLWMVVQYQVVILEFLQEKMSAHPSSPPSCFFNNH